MAIVETKWFAAEPGKASYYVMLYNGAYDPFNRPAKPFQLFKADSWDEATKFAAAFVSMTTHQWMAVSALSPEGAYHGSNIELAHRDYWNDGKQKWYEEKKLPPGVLKEMSNITVEPIARESEDVEKARKKMKELFTGTTLDGYIEAAKVKSLDEFNDEEKEAHEDGDGWDMSLKDSHGAFTFRGWVLRNKRADIDTQSLNYSVDEAIRSNPDLKADEARQQVESAHEGQVSTGEWGDIATAIDWERISEKAHGERLAKSRVEEIKQELKQLRDAGVITREEESRLLGVSVERLTSKQKEAFMNRIVDLEKQLEATKKPETAPKKELNFTEQQADLLLDYFTTAIRKGQNKDPTPAELEKIGAFIDKLQRTKLQLNFDKAKKDVEEYAKGLNALARGAGIPQRREQRRISDILNKMLEGPLSPEEEDELMKLEGKIETEEHLPLGLMEPSYPRPTVRLIAESGPEKYPLGKPITPGTVYPREIMRTWDPANARQNADRLEKIGYKVRVEEF